MLGAPTFATARTWPAAVDELGRVYHRLLDADRELVSAAA
jgi:hypothetical protein